MISGLPPYQINRRGLSRSFQVTNVFANMSVWENLRCAVLWTDGHHYAFWKNIDNLPEVRDRTAQMLSDIGLTARRDVPAGLLTYAEQRALEIGITVAGGADVILLDEPTAGMSHAETERAVALIRRLTEGRTLVIVEHDMSVVFGLADRISVLVYGHIIASGTPEEIRGESEGQGSLSRRGGRLMLEVEDLHAYYGKSHILQGVDHADRCRRGRKPARAATASAAPRPSRRSWARCRRRVRSGSRALTSRGCRAIRLPISASAMFLSTAISFPA